MWSPDGQMVSVTVVSGRLTVYGAGGEPRVYRQGEGYTAGWTTYRPVNETDGRVETAIVSYER